MLRCIFAFLTLAGNTLAIAGTPCAAIDEEDAREPLVVSNGIVCFKLQLAFDNDGKVLPDEEIHAYFIHQDQKVIKVSDWVALGKIEDAFNFDVDKDGKEDVVVIGSEEIRTYTGTCMVGPWYFISVFKQTASGFERDRRASEWFGAGADLAEGNPAPDKETCDEDKLIYAYPYKTRDVIKKTLSSSPFISFIANDTALPATVIRKSWLYESATVATKTKKYLIAGDKIMVDEVTADLCHITYIGGKKPLQMWLLCNALELATDSKRRKN
jgi:hypothetical protein